MMKSLFCARSTRNAGWRMRRVRERASAEGKNSWTSSCIIADCRVCMISAVFSIYIARRRSKRQGDDTLLTYWANLLDVWSIEYNCYGWLLEGHEISSFERQRRRFFCKLLLLNDCRFFFHKKWQSRGRNVFKTHEVNGVFKIYLTQRFFNPWSSMNKKIQ